MNLRKRISLAVRSRRIGSGPWSIISDDCWGGEFYREFSLEYTTPFIGLFVPPTMYLQLLTDLRGYLSQPLTFHPVGGAGEKYPVGKVNDVDIHFMHYHSEAEAIEKWERRKKRINWDHLFIKWDAGKGPITDEMQSRWNALPFNQKVCFVKTPTPGLSNSFEVPRWNMDGAAMYWLAQETFDLPAWLRGGSGRMTPMQKLAFHSFHNPHLRTKVRSLVKPAARR